MKDSELSIVKVSNELTTFFDDNEEYIDEWLNDYVPALESKPCELMRTKQGREQIIQCIEAMKSGDIWTIE